MRGESGEHARTGVRDEPARTGRSQRRHRRGGPAFNYPGTRTYLPGANELLNEGRARSEAESSAKSPALGGTGVMLRTRQYSVNNVTSELRACGQRGGRERARTETRHPLPRGPDIEWSAARLSPRLCL